MASGKSVSYKRTFPAPTEDPVPRKQRFDLGRDDSSKESKSNTVELLKPPRRTLTNNSDPPQPQTSNGGASTSFSSSKDSKDVPINTKKQELVEWVANRLQENSWFSSVKESFRGKLSSVQSASLTANEKKITEDLIREVGVGARASLPDDVKKELVVAVQGYLNAQSDKVIRQFTADRQRTGSASVR